MSANTYIGIDLGTSSVKLILSDNKGKILSVTGGEYPVHYPKTGWSEQNPADWYAVTVKALKKLLDGQDKKAVKGISFGGQMHGLVMLDKEDNVIRPAILWNDGRTQKQTDYLNNVIGKKALSDMTANIAFAGFTAPKILWVKENEPQNYRRINKIMLPKDYLAYKLSGSFSTDLSDASGMLLIDVKSRGWSQKMCEICGVDKAWLPKLYESYEVTGTLISSLADELGLNSNVKVIAGAGDNAAAAVGTNTVGDGACNVSLGTSGTIFISSKSFSVDNQNALHSFCHADGTYHLMGCILSAASCNKWWVKDILGSGYAQEFGGIEKYLGKNNVYFLPYLMGERSPHNDVNARGAFIGMRPDTTREEMSLAVMEGVTFALNDCLEIARQNGVRVTRTGICGGGAVNPVWRKIAAAVFGMPVDTLTAEEGPAYGGAILAMVGCGEYPSVRDAASACVKIKETTEPDSSLVSEYKAKYLVFKELYPALKNAFKLI